MRENNFDFLRFMAASLVLFSHSYPLYGLETEPLAALTRFDTFGGFSVGLFFTISGYLITASWCRKPEIFSYLKNRVLRIFPAYCVVILLTIPVMGIAVSTLPLKEYFLHPVTAKYLLNLTIYFKQYSLPGVFEELPKSTINGSIWTLSKEFTLYLFILLLGVCRLLRGRVIIALYLAIFIGYITYMETHEHLPDAWTRASLAKNAVYFLAGSIFWIYRDSFRFSSYVAAGLVGVLILASGNPPYCKYIFIFCMPYLIMWLSFTPIKGIKNFGKYGDFSYGMYLYAFPVQQCYMHFIGNAYGFWLFIIISWVITLLFAVASWYLVEKPALRLKSFTLRQDNIAFSH